MLCMEVDETAAYIDNKIKTQNIIQMDGISAAAKLRADCRDGAQDRGT